MENIPYLTCKKIIIWQLLSTGGKHFFWMNEKNLINMHVLMRYALNIDNENIVILCSSGKLRAQETIKFLVYDYLLS